MNLLVNAAQAIPEKGEIYITTRPLGEDKVQVVIRDTGKGIPPENLKKIFDPFFTTKPVGKGTGLGLSIALGIIGKHQGTISVDSTPDVGTTFTIILPVDQPDQEENNTPDIPTSSQP
jgi:signal transduction histidine kinase